MCGRYVSVARMAELIEQYKSRRWGPAAGHCAPVGAPAGSARDNPEFVCRPNSNDRHRRSWIEFGTKRPWGQVPPLEPRNRSEDLVQRRSATSRASRSRP